MSKIPSEPLRTRGAWTAAGGAVVAALVAWGLPLTDAQQAAVTGLLVVAGPLVVAYLARKKVWSPASVARLEAELTKPAEE